MKKDTFKISNQILKSRLIVGTGKYKSFKETAQAVIASGADMVTVAVRRINILDKKKPLLTDFLNPKKIKYLPNTAGCFNSEEALRTLRLAREMGGWKMVKLEVLGDKKTLYPDMIETLKATKVLVKEGFKVLVYCSDDPLLAKELEYLGANQSIWEQPGANDLRIDFLRLIQDPIDEITDYYSRLIETDIDPYGTGQQPAWLYIQEALGLLINVAFSLDISVLT